LRLIAPDQVSWDIFDRSGSEAGDGEGMWDDAKWGEANEEGSGEESDESEEDEDDDEEEEEEEEDSEEGEDEDEDEDEGGAAWTADDDAKPSAIATTATATATATAAEDTSWLRRKGGLIRKDGLIRKGGPSVNGLIHSHSPAARKRRGGGRRVLYIQMEYCKRTLHDVLAEGALSEDKIWRLLRQLLGGLQVSTSDGF
jgi:hypothetical protein